ncbi:MAG: hypothetical protein NC247_06535 [Ruminococcus flavefaciens]|nr:hypothetical protein [Ruminococcus flavefaciens]
MKKKKIVIVGIGILLFVIALIVLLASNSKWSETRFEAVVQETVTMPDGEIRLIVKRTTEIYGDPLNSLHIGEETKLLDTDGKTITVESLKSGIKVKVTLKNAFTEETPFYYPTAYEVKIIENAS